MNNKRMFWLVITAALSVVVLALVIVLRNHGPSRQYQEYKAWASTFHVSNWELSEDTTKAFAEANCKPLGEGKTPGFLIKNEDHLKATAAVLQSYCPQSLGKYLNTIDKGYDGEYSSATATIRKEVSH